VRSTLTDGRGVARRELPDREYEQVFFRCATTGCYDDRNLVDHFGSLPFLIIPAVDRFARSTEAGADLAASLLHSQAHARGARMLRTALGPAVASFLEDPSVVEVMLNPDGKLWIDRLSSGLEDSGCRMSTADGERIVRLIAHHVGAEVHPGSPRVSASWRRPLSRSESLPSRCSRSTTTRVRV